MRLSVAMCTYNGAAYLQEQLDSISKQTRLPDELVVCDDGSTDSTITICETYQNDVSFPVTIYHNAETLGAARNFEQAIQLCSSDVIVLADQDDVWLSEKLARLEAVLAADTAVGAVFSDAEVVDETLRPLGYSLWQYLDFNRRERRKMASGSGTQVLLRHNVVCGATLAFRAGFRELALPAPPGWMHDEWVALMISIFSRLALIRKPLILYRQHPGSQIGSRKKSLLERLSEVQQRDFHPAQAKLEQCMAARERLAAINETLTRDQVMERLEAKIQHMQVRAALQNLTGSRWLALLELAARRYHRYSNGFSSFVRDIL